MNIRKEDEKENSKRNEILSRRGFICSGLHN